MNIKCQLAEVVYWYVTYIFIKKVDLLQLFSNNLQGSATDMWLRNLRDRWNPLLIKNIQVWPHYKFYIHF